ncbi:MAG: N-acetylmuramoyl-L-alanine amidase [Limnochordia bacterium]
MLSVKRAKSIWIGIAAILASAACLLIAEPLIVSVVSELDGYVVAIDPGHGGRDSGSSHAGFTEKDITLLLSMAIADEIRARGGIAVLTRDTDTDLWDQVTYQDEIEYTKKEYEQDLELGRKIDPRDRGIALGTRFPPTYRLGLRARLLVAQQHNANILISIHTNHFRSESAKGAVTLYQSHSDLSRQLAAAIQHYLKDLLPGRAEPGISPDDFFILRRSPIPAVLIEIGFVSNKHDREFMLSESGRQAIAKAVANGIQDYFRLLKYPL